MITLKGVSAADQVTPVVANYSIKVDHFFNECDTAKVFHIKLNSLWQDVSKKATANFVFNSVYGAIDASVSSSKQDLK